MTDPRQLSRRAWDRRDDETAAAFAAFTVFLDLGPARTITAAYRRHRNRPDAERPSSRFDTWARDHDWNGRAAQHDAHVRREKVAALLSLDIGELLDELRADAVTHAGEMLRAADLIGQALIETAQRYAERMRQPGYVASAQDIRALGQVWKTLTEHGMNTKGAALGVHQLLGLLTGEQPLIAPSRDDRAADRAEDPAPFGLRRLLPKSRGEA